MNDSASNIISQEGFAGTQRARQCPCRKFDRARVPAQKLGSSRQGGFGAVHAQRQLKAPFGQPWIRPQLPLPNLRKRFDAAQRVRFGALVGTNPLAFGA